MTFQGKRVLLAEDDELNQEMMKDLLEGMHMEVVVANDGNEAIAKFQQGKFDIILMDIRMPNKDGMEAIQEIRKLDTKVPIIALTANVLAVEKEGIFAIGANAFLFKPIHIEELKKIMDAQLTKAKESSQMPKLEHPDHKDKG